MATLDDRFPAELPRLTTLADADVLPVQAASDPTQVKYIRNDDFKETTVRPLAEAPPLGYAGVAARSVAQVRADLVNIGDYGCLMDGAIHPVTDAIGSGFFAPKLPKFANFAALQTAMPWVQSTSDSLDWACLQYAIANMKASVWRGGTWKNCGQPRLYQPGNKNLKTNRGIFAGSDRDGPSPDNAPSFAMWIEFDGLITSALDPLVSDDKIGFDLSGARFGNYRFRLAGDSALPPDVMCMLARGGLTDPVNPLTGRSSDDFTMDRVQLDGSAKICALMEYAVEDVFHVGCTYRVDGGGAKCCVLLTKRDAEGVILKNQTDRPSGIQQTFVGGKFDKCYLYYDMPAGNVPLIAAPLIIDGSARHTFEDLFFSSLAGGTTFIPLVILMGADNGANAPVRQTFLRPHFHGLFGHSIQLLNATQYLVLNQPFENVGRAGAGVTYFTVHCESGATIARGSLLDIESVKTEPTTNLTQVRLTMLTQPGNIVVNGNFAGQVLGYSNTPMTVSGTTNVDFTEFDTGASYRVANTAPVAAPVTINATHNRAPITVTTAGNITLSNAATLGPRFNTDVFNDSGADCTVIMPDVVTTFALPDKWVLNVSVQNGKVWTYMGAGAALPQ
jgi:hypothetical protein